MATQSLKLTFCRNSWPGFRLRQICQELLQRKPLHLSAALFCEQRKRQIFAIQAYQKITKKQLVEWLGAKELVSTISPQEAQVRVRLTWQEFAKQLWLTS